MVFGELYQLIQESVAYYTKDDNEKIQESLRAFKLRHYWNPQRKTILVDNMEFHVRLVSEMNGLLQAILPDASKATHADMSSGKITIDKSFFRLKSPSEQDAILMHEIGHVKMHSTSTRMKYRDSDYVAMGVVDEEIERILDAMKSFGISLSDEELEREKEKMRKEYSKYLSSGTELKFKREVREKMMQELKRKYAKGGHSNPIEFEADRYAANKTSGRDIMNGLKHMYAMDEDDIDEYRTQMKKNGYTDAEISQILREYKNGVKDDVSSRKKALRNRHMKKLSRKGMYQAKVSIPDSLDK